jgi:hypothetical protein
MQANLCILLSGGSSGANRCPGGSSGFQVWASECDLMSCRLLLMFGSGSVMLFGRSSSYDGWVNPCPPEILSSSLGSNCVVQLSSAIRYTF